jgi:aspartyl-tRNA(Asn)/glutamyl-tRNA(Gln) amidotransferase subunit C
MQAVDTEGLEPMAHPLGGAQRLRDDVVTEVDERAGNLANAPEQQDGLFLVPRVIE